MFVRLPNVPNVEHNLPVGSRLNPFWEPRQDAVKPVQNLWASSADLSWFQNYTANGDLF